MIIEQYVNRLIFHIIVFSRVLLLLVSIMLFLSVTGAASAAELPASVESIRYENFFPGGTKEWQKVDIVLEERLKEYSWNNAAGHKLTLTVRPCNAATVQAVFADSADKLNDLLKKPDNRMLSLSEFFAIFVINESGQKHSLQLFYGTPDGVYLWKYRFPKDYRFNGDDYISKISFAAREHQYKTALQEGNVIMGRWSNQVHEYAKLLLKIDDPEAETIYHYLLRTNPSNFEAHVEFMSLTKDQGKKTESARIVRKSAEEKALLDATAKVLHEKIPYVESYPVLSRLDKGLKVILIPLTNCNPWLLKEIAATYEHITGIPVIIRRLPETLELPPPSRSVYRPQLENIAAKLWPKKKDFSDWTLAKLQEEIMNKARQDSKEALQLMTDLYRKMFDEGGQWEADPVMNRLSQAVLPYRSDDPKTMIVGLTEIDIYSGSSNFIFSIYGGLPESHVSLLSYARMRGQFTGEGQSRKRLTERIAKELVPASLKSLEIPRSTDPSCPYSYASGLQRLDEKTLTLSDQVRHEIDRIRTRQAKKE